MGRPDTGLESPFRNPTGSKGNVALHRGLTQDSVGDEGHSDEVYIRVELGKRRLYGLLDTGCELSIVGRRILPKIPLRPTDRKLFAANGTPIPLLGEADVGIRIG